MGIEVRRDDLGNVTIINLQTGKSEVVATGVAGRPTEKTIAGVVELPAHSWGKLA